MDITFLAPYKGLSGGLRVIAAYGNALMRRGHRVTVVYPHHALHWKTALRKELRRRFLSEQDHLDRFQGKLLEVPELSELHIPEADCIIATAWQTAEIVNELPAKFGKKFYLIQGYETWNGDVERIEATYRFPLKKVVISHWLKGIVESRCDDKDVPVVPNGRDFHLSESLGEGMHRKYDVGMTYSSVELKRAVDGFAALEIVRREIPDLSVVMFGSERPLQQLPENTAFFECPSQDTIRDIYLATRIWMNTSREEGFCLPALEGMSLGCAVVATNSRGIEDIIDSGKNGYLVAPENPEALASRLIEVLKNQELELQFQSAGLLNSERFSWARSGALLEEYIRANLEGEREHAE